MILCVWEMRLFELGGAIVKRAMDVGGDENVWDATSAIEWCSVFKSESEKTHDDDA